MSSFSTPPAPLDPAVQTLAVRLADWAPVRIDGPDADAFLQGQLSSDLRALSPVRAQWSGWSSPKGRLLVVPLLVRDATGTIDLWMPAALIEPVLKRLRMFVLRSKVVLEDWRHQRAALGLMGPEAAAALSALDLPVPADPLQVADANPIQVMRCQGPAPRYLLFGAREPLHALFPRATDGIQAWRSAEIAAGVPIVLPPTQDHWVAQMVNLDLLGGVSFDKGCYTGQEVIARLHYLGNLKKRLFVLRGDGPLPAPGADIYDAAGDGQAVGEIVEAATQGAGFVATAVLQLARRDAESLRLGTPDGPALGRPETAPGMTY